MNVAALGNMVPQLHIHVITRFEGDAAWPGPVWGVGEAEPYDPTALLQTVERLNAALRRA
jgi:diadenosine tetraphosphate (Ap4A) HIT family hydrolase